MGNKSGKVENYVLFSFKQRSRFWSFFILCFKVCRRINGWFQYATIAKNDYWIAVLGLVPKFSLPFYPKIHPPKNKINVEDSPYFNMMLNVMTSLVIFTIFNWCTTVVFHHFGRTFHPNPSVPFILGIKSLSPTSNLLKLQPTITVFLFVVVFSITGFN